MSHLRDTARRLLKPRSHAYREIFGRLNAAVVGDVLLRVDEFDGSFKVSPRSDLFRRLILNGYYEPDLKDLFVSHLAPGLDVVDVGANIGFFSILAAKHLKTSRVLAIEPTPGAHARLQENIAINGLGEGVIVYNGAVSDKPGTMDINLIEGREEYSSLAPITHPATALDKQQSVSVEVSTVDDLVERHGLRPGLIKVDVEGGEGLVFAGAMATLEKHRPVIISELSDALLANFGTSAAAVIARIEGAGYTVRDPKRPNEPAGTQAYGDIVCIPKEGPRKTI